MNVEVQRRMLWGTAAALLLIALAAWHQYMYPTPTPPASTGYYTGAMQSKGNPNVWVTADGKIVVPPPSYRPPKASAAKKAPPQGAASDL